MMVLLKMLIALWTFHSFIPSFTNHSFPKHKETVMGLALQQALGIQRIRITIIFPGGYHIVGKLCIETNIQ